MSSLSGTGARYVEFSIAVLGVALFVGWLGFVAFVYSQGGDQIAGAMAVLTVFVAVIYYANERRE